MNTRRAVAFVAVGLFILVDVALIALFAATTTAPASNVPPIAVSSLPTEPSTPIGSVQAATLAPSSRLLTAFDGEVAWRAETGQCPQSVVVVERSTDGGKSWDGFDLGTTGGLSGAAALQSTDDPSSAYLIALDKTGCAASWVGTEDGGKEWAAFPDRITTAWYVNPADRASVNAPGAVHPAPCPSVVGLAPYSGTSAAVICSDQSVFRTVDGGATWLDTAPVEGALAIARGTEGYLVVSRASDVACTGFVLTEIPEASSGAVKTLSTCINADMSAPDIAIAGNSAAIWLWAGNSVLRSLDEGRTWR